MRLPAALILPILAHALSPEATAQDNVLVLIADDLGTDYVAAYAEGPDYGPTPNIDALAAQGVLFRNAWANPMCSPTRACFNTGRHGYRTGVGSPGSGSTLNLDEVTLPEALDASGSGYGHALIGKWHLGTASPTYPNDAGWSHYSGMLSNPGSYFDWARTVNGIQAQSTTYSTTQLVDDAISWISQQDQPWVCAVAFNAPHGPFHEPPSSLHSQDLSGNTSNQQRYRAMVEAMDTEIGRLIASLGAASASTNIIFFGDNGTPGQVSVAPFVSDHAKGSAYEGGVNVPFIVSGPVVSAPNREVTALISVVDVFESISDLVATELAPPVIRQDSVSFVPYLTDPDQSALRAHVYSEKFNGSNPDGNGFSLVRGNRFKLIRHYGQGGVADEEMYDLSTDPFETQDLLPGLSAEVQSAYDDLDAYMRSVRDKTGGFEKIGMPTCVGSNGNLDIAAVGTPSLGASYSVALDQAPASSVALLAIGFSDTFDNRLGTSLPLDLSILGGAPGCLLRSSTEWLAAVPTSKTGEATVVFSVPALHTLIAGSVLHAWIVADPGAVNNPLGITVSPSIRVTFGE